MTYPPGKGLVKEAASLGSRKSCRSKRWWELSDWKFGTQRICSCFTVDSREARGLRGRRVGNKSIWVALVVCPLGQAKSIGLWWWARNKLMAGMTGQVLKVWEHQWWESWIWKELHTCNDGDSQGKLSGPQMCFIGLYSPSIQHSSLASSTELEPMLYKELSCPTYFFCFILNCYPPCLPSSNQLDGSDVFPKSTKLLPTSEFICLPCYLSGHHQATPTTFSPGSFSTTQISTQSVLTHQSLTSYSSSVSSFCFISFILTYYHLLVCSGTYNLFFEYFVCTEMPMRQKLNLAAYPLL